MYSHDFVEVMIDFQKNNQQIIEHTEQIDPLVDNERWTLRIRACKESNDPEGMSSYRVITYDRTSKSNHQYFLPLDL